MLLKKATEREWKPAGPEGVERSLFRNNDTGGRSSVVRLKEGAHVPRHAHHGNEEVVVLTGAYTDEFTHLGPGAYYHYPPGSVHGTRIDDGEPCWTVGLLEHGIKFRGVLGALQWMADPATRARWRRFRREAENR